MGVSIDSIHSHANWACDLGGVSFPLLADFHPKGAVAESFGHYLSEAGITDRSTVIIDRDGVVQYSVSVTPGGKRDIDELAAECEKIESAQSGSGSTPAPGALPDGTELYVKSACGFSRRALLALDNLGIRDAVKVRNVTEDADAAKALQATGGKDQAPCLVLGGEAVYETEELMKRLADLLSPVG